MIVMLAAMVMQSALPSGRPPEIVPDFSGAREVTPEDLTADAGVLACNLQGDDGRTFSFVLRDGGGRGYRDPCTGEVSTTPDEISVSSNPTNLFEGYSFQKGAGAKDWQYSAWRKPAGALGEKFEFQLSRVTPPLQRSPERYAILLSGGWGWMQLARAVGFCDLRRTSQQPLTEAETEKYLKK